MSSSFNEYQSWSLDMQIISTSFFPIFYYRFWLLKVDSEFLIYSSGNIMASLFS